MAGFADTLGPVTTYGYTNIGTSFSYNYATGYNGYCCSGSTSAPTQTGLYNFTINLGSDAGAFSSGTLQLSGLSSGSYYSTQNNHSWLFTYGGSFGTATAGSASMTLGGNGDYNLDAALLSQIGAGSALIISGQIYITIADAGGGSYTQYNGYNYQTCGSFWSGYYSCNYTYYYTAYSSGYGDYGTDLTAGATLVPQQQLLATTPEPATLVLFSSGLVVFGGVVRKKLRK